MTDWAKLLNEFMGNPPDCEDQEEFDKAVNSVCIRAIQENIIEVPDSVVIKEMEEMFKNGQ